MFIITSGLEKKELTIEKKPSNSGVTHLDDLSPEEFLEKLLETPVARCDEASWLFLNISMAGWNALFSILLTFFWGYNTLICKNALKS